MDLSATRAVCASAGPTSCAPSGRRFRAHAAARLRAQHGERLRAPRGAQPHRDDAHVPGRGLRLPGGTRAQRRAALGFRSRRIFAHGTLDLAAGRSPLAASRRAPAAAECVRAYDVRRPARLRSRLRRARGFGAPLFRGTHASQSPCGAAERRVHELLRRAEGLERRAVEAAFRHRGRRDPRAAHRGAGARVRQQRRELERGCDEAAGDGARRPDAGRQRHADAALVETAPTSAGRRVRGCLGAPAHMDVYTDDEITSGGTVDGPSKQEVEVTTTWKLVGTPTPSPSP